MKTGTFTVVGSSGFIGRALCAYLTQCGHAVVALNRAPEDLTTEFGHVIDCGGLTSDFRTRPNEIFEAHVSRVDRFLSAARFDSYLYLSSTRIYKNSTATREEDPVEVQPAVFDDSYNISKIAGESACLMRDKSEVRVARLSNVLGANPDPSVFLTSLIGEARATGRIILKESLQSSKDYIALDDVCRYLALIAREGSQRLYNLAYGENRTHRQVVEEIGRWLPCTVEAPDAPTRAFPPTDARRLTGEFGLPQTTPEQAIATVLSS